MAEERTKGIVILLYQYSVVVKGIERKLKELGYYVEVLSETFNRVEKCSSSTDLFIFYLPGDIADDMFKLDQFDKVCAKIKGLGKNMIILGEKKDHSEIMNNHPDAGSFTWLDRPVDNDVLKKEIEKAIATPVSTGERKRVLIVDDDPSYAGMVREWIKDSYKADVVTAGMQAITFLLKNPVDMILLDYEMPVVDGPQVLQMLRQEEGTKNIPVIFLTGNGTKEAVTRVMQLKPDGYILKSTTRNDLLAYLNKHIG